MTKHITALCSALAIAGVSVTAQAPKDRSQTTPAATVTVTGCVTTGDLSISAGGGRAPGREVSGARKSDAASRYMLTSVQESTGGTQATGQHEGGHHMSYALTTEGSTIDLSKHLNHKVELTGTLNETTRQSPQAASTGTSGSTGTATVGRDANAMRMPAATLNVTSLKMVAATCP